MYRIDIALKPARTGTARPIFLGLYDGNPVPLQRFWTHEEGSKTYTDRDLAARVARSLALERTDMVFSVVDSLANELDGLVFSFEPSFPAETIRQARQYWARLDETELHQFYRHYTTGPGKGIFNGVDENTCFEDYVVISAQTTTFEIAHDI